MPVGCTPKSCQDTEQFCRKFFPDEMEQCVTSQSATPNLLVGAGPSIKDVQTACCGNLAEKNWGSVPWLHESACGEPMTSSCKWDSRRKEVTSLVDPSEATQCVQKDRTAPDAKCTTLLTSADCGTNAACKWNSDFDLAKCKTAPAYEHLAGMAYD